MVCVCVCVCGVCVRVFHIAKLHAIRRVGEDPQLHVGAPLRWRLRSAKIRVSFHTCHKTQEAQTRCEICKEQKTHGNEQFKRTALR